jgi:hypothetical protein
LLAEKSEQEGKDEGVNKDGGDTSLARGKDAVAAWREGQEHPGAEQGKEEGGHDEVGGGQHELEEPGDYAVKHDKDKHVEEHGGLGGQTALDLLSRQLEEEPGAECDKECSGDKNLGACNINHLCMLTKYILRSKTV